MIHPVSVACAKPDLRCQRSIPVAAEAVRQPCDFRLVTEAFAGPSAPPRICSNTRGRLAKNIPVRVNKVTVGIENNIRDHPRVNDFFHFFKKRFETSLLGFARNPPKNRAAPNQAFMSLSVRVTLYYL
jgi:hypothetical protein